MKKEYFFISIISYLIMVSLFPNFIIAQKTDINTSAYNRFKEHATTSHNGLQTIVPFNDFETDVDTIADTIKTHPKKSVSEMNLEELGNLRVSPFDVSTSLDKGYRASNSVSGSRFDTPIRYLPFAIQAFTKSFIIDQKPVNIFDITHYSPGVTYRSNDFNEGNANVAIRGFAVGSLAGGNIHILRDGFHGPSIFDFTNISRVEVVKGPSSFLYGQVAPGGIVNIITKNPQPTFSAVANVNYGSYNQLRFDVDVTGPASQTLFYRFAASYDKDMKYWEPYDAYSRDFAPSILWQPNDRLSISIKYENFLKEETPQVMQKPGYNIQSGVIPSPTDPNLSGVDVPGLPDNWNSMSYSDFRNSKTNNLSAWIDYQAGEHWNLRIGYSHLEYKIDALFSGNLGMANNFTFMQGRRFRQQIYSNRDDSYETHATGKYEFGYMSLRLLIGAQYVKRVLDRWAAQAPNDPALGSNPTASPLPLWDLRNPSTWNRVVRIPLSELIANPTDEKVEYTDKSLYAGTTFGFFDDRLLVLAGWRFTSTESQFANRLSKETQPKAKVSMITPQYGILYKITNGFSLFASYAESFVPSTYLLTNADETRKVAEPTKGLGYDIGIKTDLLDGRVSGTLTYFNILNKNIVNDLSVTNSTGSVLISNVQSGEQRSYGVELDASISATDNWQFYISYSYMNARITEFSGNDDIILTQDPNKLNAADKANYKNVWRFHNAPLQMSAPHLANIWTRYDFTRDALFGIHIAGGAYFVYDQTLLPDSPESSHQTYTLLSATLGYSWNWYGLQMNLDIMGKNLANYYYRPSQSSRCRPREVILTLTTKF